MKKAFSFLLCLLLLGVSSNVFAQLKVPILVYHWIDEYNGVGPKELYVTPDNFEKQMIYLRDNGFTLLTFERWNEINKVQKPIFITFDDGWKNNLNAFRILQKLETEQFKPSGTFFIISSFVERPERLSKEDIKMLADSGIISIQSHTSTHPNLTKIKDYVFQFKVSKEKIEEMTGRPVIALAYPYGAFDGEVIAAAKKYYQFGLTTIPGPYSNKGIKDELYLLPRIYVNYSTSLEDFAKIVNQ